jgi:hypothetical protein
LPLQDEPPRRHGVAIVFEVDKAEADKYFTWNWAHDRSHELLTDLRRRGARATAVVTEVDAYPGPLSTGPAVTHVRDDDATNACPVCCRTFEAQGRQRFCSTGCRQAAWRASRRAPIKPVVARSGTVYECPGCEARYIGEQRCDDCNTWCRRLGPGAPCPQCDEPVAMSDLFSDDQLAQNPMPTRRKS